MYPVITVVHIVACLFLIGVVLLQQGKGADMGAVFGGSSQTLFGSGGAGNFLTRLTTAMAVVFMATSLTLAYGSARRVTTTIFDDAPLPVTDSAPADAPLPVTDSAPADAPAAGEMPVPVAPDAEPAPQAEAAPEAAAPAAGGVAVVEEPAAGQPADSVAGEVKDAVAAVAEEAQAVAGEVEAGDEAAVEAVKEDGEAAAQKAEGAADAVAGAEVEVEEAPGETDPVPPAVP